MSWAWLPWAAGGYLAGTLPSTWIVARAKRASALISASGRSAGETDPHILMAKHLGVGWTALAATLDVLKGLVYVMAARHWGHLDRRWRGSAWWSATRSPSTPSRWRDAGWPRPQACTWRCSPGRWWWRGC